jgi:hypothetical protein
LSLVFGSFFTFSLAKLVAMIKVEPSNKHAAHRGDGGLYGSWISSPFPMPISHRLILTRKPESREKKWSAKRDKGGRASAT